VSDPAPRTRLIINADDFGISPAVNDGILEAHAAGTVTSTSMLVRCPGWEDAVGKVVGGHTLGIGLHFNLLIGAPLVPAVTTGNRRTGRFLTLSELTARSLGARLDSAEVEAECEAQCKAIEATGVKLTHIDSHRHTHALPTVRGAVARVAERRGIPLRRPVESHRRFPNDIPSQLHRAVIAWSWHTTSLFVRYARAADHFIGVSMQGGDKFERLLTHVLDRLPEGSVEMMVHPGRVDAALESVDGYTWQRKLELTALTSRTVKNRLSARDIRLINFGQL
jgi:predicted glycoside hydrolase/deacetylase ChbG (UPF0249 family)